MILALESDKLAACYTDVAPQEPLPADSPLWSAKNLHITPHNSGNPDGVGGEVWELGMPRPVYTEAALECFGQQLSLYLQGEPVFNIVDNTAGY